MKTIGVTGGIGAGKTQVLKYIEDHYDARIIVADMAAKALEEPGQCCYADLVEAFGADLLDETGKIDKSKLSQLIYSDKKALETVNGIVHPAVKRYILDAMEAERKAGRKFFIVEAALLIEEGYGDILDEMWYIYASEPVRRMRLKNSRGYSDELIDGIMAAQKTEDEFRAACDYVINNDASIESMERQIKEILEGVCRSNG